MNLKDLATLPVFASSLALCALVATLGITMLLKAILRKASNLAAFAGLTKAEVLSIEAAGKLHNKLEELIGLVLNIENHSAEAPAVFHDHSWARLLQLCDDLELARSELHELIGAKRFEDAARLGRFLCGFDCSLPSFSRHPDAIDLKSLVFWQRDTTDLLHRMVARLEDLGREHDQDLTPRSSFSPELQKALEQAKTYVDENNFIE